MAYNDRKTLIQKIEDLREGRTLVSIFNFDRLSEPYLAGISTQFYADIKETLYRVLKASKKRAGIDVFLYTRGGDINAVWPVVSLLREFDRNFQVLVPFKCHSSGTLLALGAEHIVLGPLSELSPIDPSTGNQFNPVDPGNASKKTPISVGDVRAYRAFILEQYKSVQPDAEAIKPADLRPMLEKLTERVHPLALGNVQRVSQQILQLAENLLQLHGNKTENVAQIVDALTHRFHSHQHMINRQEARSILGTRVEFASAKLSSALDELLLNYEESFQLRRTFYLHHYLQGKTEAEVRYTGAVVESRAQSWLFHTRAKVRQLSTIPANVQIQLPPGQAMPVIPGLKRSVDIEIQEQGWKRNTDTGGNAS
jgi:hypothetical protein